MKILFANMLTGFLSIAPVAAFSQNETNHWVFGFNAGLDFSTGAPEAEAGNFIGSEGTAAISDPITGNLLMYTNGSTVYDAANVPMPNGTGLNGCSSSTQSAIIVPQPGNSTIYYVFTVDCIENNGLGGYNYSVVDMTLNGGLGDVVAGQKNVFLQGPSGEEISAVKHANCIDWWIMTKEHGTNVYKVFLLTETGVSGPVVSTIGIDTQETRGQSKFSPDGRKYAIASYTQSLTQLFDFDDVTGILSNPVTLVNNVGQTGEYSWGVSFSENSCVLYATRGPNPTHRLYQYDLSSGDPATIIASSTLIATLGFMPQLQMGKDARIYISDLGSANISVIEHPDVLGVGCGFVPQTVHVVVTAGNFCSGGLCNFPDSFFNPGDPCASVPETKQPLPDIPNVITPDGDGINDAFMIAGLPPESSLSILNRWGNRVFETETYENDWKGNITDGVYFYILKTPDDHTFSGFVQVINGKQEP